MKSAIMTEYNLLPSKLNSKRVEKWNGSSNRHLNFFFLNGKLAILVRFVLNGDNVSRASCFFFVCNSER